MTVGTGCDKANFNEEALSIGRISKGAWLKEITEVVEKGNNRFCTQAGGRLQNVPVSIRNEEF